MSNFSGPGAYGSDPEDTHIAWVVYFHYNLCLAFVKQFPAFINPYLSFVNSGWGPAKILLIFPFNIWLLFIYLATSMKRLLTLFILIFFCLFNLHAQLLQRQVITESPLSWGYAQEVEIDSTTMLISNPQEDIVYVYELEEGLWNLSQELKPSDFTGDKKFGMKMAISGDDIIVGASNDQNDTGAVYFFHRGPEGIWEETTKITSPVPSTRYSDAYWGGILINIHNGIATAGRNNGLNRFFHVMRQKEDFSWELSDTLRIETGFIGASESCIEDSMIVVRDSYRPSLLIFTLLENGEWSEAERVFPSETEGLEYFAMSLDCDGQRILAGSHYDDLFIGDDTIPDAGSAFLFEKVNGSWTNTSRFMSDIPKEDDAFGVSVVIEDGRIVIGARNHDLDENEEDSVANAGAVYIFDKSDNDWTISQKLVPSTRIPNGKFGRSLSFDNGILLASASKRAYVFHEGEDCMGISGGEAFYDVCRICVEGSSLNEENETPNNCMITGTSKPTQGSVTITPNPFTEQGFKVESQQDIKNVTVRSLNGIALFQGDPGGVSNASENLHPGIYIIDIQFQDGTVDRRKVVRF